MELKVNEIELSLLKSIFEQMAIQDHSSMLGFMHGMNRFVSLNIALKKNQKETLDDLAAKLGVSHGIKRVKK